MMIAYDNAPNAERPVRWDMTPMLTISVLLRMLGAISSFTVFWIAERYIGISRAEIRTLIFLKLVVTGHMTDLSDQEQGRDLGAALADLEAGGCMRRDTDRRHLWHALAGSLPRLVGATPVISSDRRFTMVNGIAIYFCDPQSP